MSYATLFRKNVGIIFAIGTSLTITSVAVFVKKTPSVNKTDLAAFRVTIQYLILLPIVLSKCKLYEVFPIHEPRTSKLLLTRSISATVGFTCSYYAYSTLPIGDCYTITCFRSIVCVILAWLFLGEKLTKKEIAVFLVGLVGMGFVVRPKALLTWDEELIQQDFGINIETFVFGVFMAVTSTFCASVSTVVIRAVMTEQKEKSKKLKLAMEGRINNAEKIDQKDDNSAANIHWTVLIFHYSLLSILILYPYRIYQTGFSTEFITAFIMNPCQSEIIYCFIVALGGLMASSLNIFALRNTSVFNVSIVTSTLTIVFGFMFDYFLFDKVPSTNSLIGSCLIFLSVAVLMLMKT